MGRQDLVEDVEEKEQYFAGLSREKKGDSLEQKGLLHVLRSCFIQLDLFPIHI